MEHVYAIYCIYEAQILGRETNFHSWCIGLDGGGSLYGMSATYPFANDFFTILIGGIIGSIFYSGGFIVAFLVSAAVNVTSLTLMIVILKGILACLQLNIEAITEIGIYQLSGVIMAKSILLLVSYIIYRYKRKKGSSIVKNILAFVSVAFGDNTASNIYTF